MHHQFHLEQIWKDKRGRYLGSCCILNSKLNLFFNYDEKYEKILFETLRDFSPEYFFYNLEKNLEARLILNFWMILDFLKSACLWKFSIYNFGRISTPWYSEKNLKMYIQIVGSVPGQLVPPSLTNSRAVWKQRGRVLSILSDFQNKWFLCVFFIQFWVLNL